MAVMRLTTPEQLANRVIFDFALQAAEKQNYPHPIAALGWLSEQIGYPGCGVWIGAEDGKLKAICVAFLPGNPMMIAPQVCVSYNEGSPALAREIAGEVKAWLRKAGYDRVWGINQSGHSDEVHARAYRWWGEPTKIGGLMEYKLRD